MAATSVLERIVLIHPCPLCPDPDDCDGHEERDEAQLEHELVIWIPLKQLAPPQAKVLE